MTTQKEKKQLPLISVVMPVYNAGAWVVSAVQSILEQSVASLELLLIDDGSTDDTVDRVMYIEDKRMRLIRQDHLGFIQALSAGIKLAQGRWIARMDGDDICHPKRLEKQLQLLESQPGAVMCGTGFGYITPRGYVLERLAPFKMRKITPEMITLGQKMFADATMVFRKEAAVQCGLYDQDIRHNELSLWYKLLECGPGYELGKNYYFQRLHSGGMNIGQMQANLDARRVRQRYNYKLSLERYKNNDQKTRKILFTSGLKKKIHLCRYAGDYLGAVIMATHGMRTMPSKALLKIVFIALTGFNSLNITKGNVKPKKVLGYRPYQAKLTADKAFFRKVGLRLN